MKSRRNPVRELLKRQAVMTIRNGMANMEVNRRERTLRVREDEAGVKFRKRLFEEGDEQSIFSFLLV